MFLVELVMFGSVGTGGVAGEWFASPKAGQFCGIWSEACDTQDFYIPPPQHTGLYLSPSAPLYRLSQLGETMQHLHFLL